MMNLSERNRKALRDFARHPDVVTLARHIQSKRTTVNHSFGLMPR